jgi:serine protease AprX
VIVSATHKGLLSLKKKLLNGYSKKIIANISAIEKIEPFSIADRLNGIDSSLLAEQSFSGKEIKVKLFDHQDQYKNRMLISSFYDFASKNNIKLKEINYTGSYGLLTARLESVSSLDRLSSFIGLRSLSLMPRFSVADFEVQANPIGKADHEIFPPPSLKDDYPIVGVIDSGVCPSCSLISPWIVARESYVPSGYEDYTHGTMVAGLIVNSRSLNFDDDHFPSTQAKIVDINVFPKGGSVSEDDLVAIIEEVIPKYPQVKIWNLSLGGNDPSHMTDFSDFAHFLDEMHDKYGCLFLVAAGNQNDLKYWPTFLQDPSVNRVSSPGDSVRALTVGSLAHKSTALSISEIDGVSPFSRIGPGPSCIPKPEITHYGGNATKSGLFTQMGVLSLGQGNSICESIGTSFSTPIASSIAAQLYHFLSGGGTKDVSTETIKAVMIHSALLNTSVVNSKTINYHGFGRPGDVIDSLYCDPHCMTLLFEADVRHGGFELEKFPFPIPDCLNTSEGKYKGEIFITLVYSPIVDKNYASEYCRINVDVGMGSYNEDEEGIRRFFSKVPPAPDDVKDLFERSRIENGFKWSPVKAYHKASPKGIYVGDWRLKVGVLRRAEMPVPETPQKITLVLSLRGLADDQPVYNETVQKMNAMGWVANDIDQHLRLRS